MGRLLDRVLDAELLEMIIKNTLPEDFDQWDICDENGWTIAHTCATVGQLPTSFNQWALADNNGRTVAHVAAHNSTCLPKDFHLTHPDIWKMKESTGMSVGEQAILRGYDISITEQ